MIAIAINIVNGTFLAIATALAIWSVSASDCVTRAHNDNQQLMTTGVVTSGGSRVQIELP